MTKEHEPRWENEIWLGGQHASENIVCKTCRLRYYYRPDGRRVDNPQTSICEKYVYPAYKPDDVYFDGAECEFYVKEE